MRTDNIDEGWIDVLGLLGKGGRIFIDPNRNNNFNFKHYTAHQKAAP